ncbi:hypothetical protein NDU88_002780 [Pleurodeles waltl]|uniref:Uncharacterized protein n=1 Tax=Pleurodeles waltl TaxID=8319 RepID=A0AAV7LDC4_PLEWA|nr:hypothetical protein NDU88_002780 [Pleurodeles waltl]
MGTFGSAFGPVFAQTRTRARPSCIPHHWRCIQGDLDVLLGDDQEAFFALSDWSGSDEKEAEDLMDKSVVDAMDIRERIRTCIQGDLDVLLGDDQEAFFALSDWSGSDEKEAEDLMDKSVVDAMDIRERIRGNECPNLLVQNLDCAYSALLCLTSD